MPSTMAHRQGDIVLVSFPFTDLTSTKVPQREQPAGNRNPDTPTPQCPRQDSNLGPTA